MTDFAEQLNALQTSTLGVTSAARDQIQATFAENSNEADEIDSTLMRLFSYMSSRSQAVSFLVGSNYVWDAEIILRAFYEANAKIWYICFCEPEKRQELVGEFWGELAATHNHKRRHKASTVANIFAQFGDAKNERTMSSLTDYQIFDFGDSNKAARRLLKNKWSFSEILSQLQESGPDEFDWKAIVGLVHMYGLQNHLVHADDAALDLMLDRKLRSSNELTLLSEAHAARIFSDQASLWLFSSISLRFRYQLKTPPDSDLFELYAEHSNLSRPFNGRLSAATQQY